MKDAAPALTEAVESAATSFPGKNPKLCMNLGQLDREERRERRTFSLWFAATTMTGWPFATERRTMEVASYMLVPPSWKAPP